MNSFPMNGFKFRLATLKKLREAVRDQRRAELGEALQADALLEEQIAALDRAMASIVEECRAASGPGPVDVDRLTQAHLHSLLLEGQKRILEHHRGLLAAEINRRREALAQADREVRILERLEAKQADRYRRRQWHQEVQHLDEVGVRQVVRGNASNDGQIFLAPPEESQV
jgi:flagellar export protein FliJ